MALKVFKYGEEVLRENSIPVDRVTEVHRQLMAEMVETMHDAGGVGLAAQQVGRTERICVIDIPPKSQTDEEALYNAPVPMPLKLVNPEIIHQEGTQLDQEGCLSFPKIGGELVRAEFVTCQYLDENNSVQIINARGLLARALQHEIDHLNGILYIDRMSATERLQYAAKLKKLAKANGGVR